MVSHLYLLDTNILSDLIKKPAGKAARKIASLESDELCCTSIIVACELSYGALKKNFPPLTAKVDQLIETIAVLPLDSQVVSRYAELRVQLESKGTPIGGNDLIIAAHAISSDLTMVTANVREFSRIPGLAVENWLE